MSFYVPIFQLNACFLENVYSGSFAHSKIRLLCLCCIAWAVYMFWMLILVSHVCSVVQLCPTLWDLMDCSPPGPSTHGNSLGKNTGVGCHALLQGIFPTQCLNPGLPHCRPILYHLSHQGSPRILEWAAYPFSRETSWPRNWTRVSCIAEGFFSKWAPREAHIIVNHIICKYFSPTSMLFFLFCWWFHLLWKNF